MENTTNYMKNGLVKNKKNKVKLIGINNKNERMRDTHPLLVKKEGRICAGFFYINE